MVLCVYKRRHPATFMGGWLYGAEFVEATEDTTYYDAMDRAWRSGEDVVVIEHDILPWGLGSLRRCAEPWCSRPYLVSGVLRLTEGLGCTKFSADLTRAFPDAVDKAGSLLEPWPEASRHWAVLDHRLAYVLKRDAGVQVHPHRATAHYH